jgi:hypothetical protein
MAVAIFVAGWLGLNSPGFWQVLWPWLIIVASTIFPALMMAFSAER